MLDLSKTSKLYVDLDGVLVDFLGGAEKALGMKFHPNKNIFPVKSPERRKAIVQTPSFWEDLEPMSGYKTLWNYVRPYNPYILSAYAEWDMRSVKEKVTWIHKWLGHIPSQKILIIQREQKRDYAKSGNTPNILIDDMRQNIVEWERNHGIGILHLGINSTISKLKTFGF